MTFLYYLFIKEINMISSGDDGTKIYFNIRKNEGYLNMNRKELKRSGIKIIRREKEQRKLFHV